jgi:hypothetical protein
MTQHKWPSREEWAQRRRTFYYDSNMHPCPATRRLSAYATDEEIATVLAELKAMLGRARRAERAANAALGPLGRQRGESKRAYDRRFHVMSREEQDIIIAGSTRVWPASLKEVLEELQQDVVPRPWATSGIAMPPLFDRIIARYVAAEKEADETWRRRVKATPIDDAAWERELERRRQDEDDAAHPERFIHSIR